MNKLTLRAICATLALSLTLPVVSMAAVAPAPSACDTQGIYAAFYNGVWNTYQDAGAGLAAVRNRVGETHNGENIRYELMYNPTNGWEDIAQTFEQRMAEQDSLLRDRWEILWEIIDGAGPQTGVIGTLAGIFTGLKNMVSGVSDYLTTKVVSSITALTANPPTMADYAEQRQRLETMGLEGKKTLLIAHSQGNLFMNVAYKYLQDRVTAGQGTAGSFGAVHIAPASPTLHGPYVLVPTDLVINALRITGTVPANNALAPSYVEQLAQGIPSPDASGHELVATYLNLAFTNATAPLKVFQQAVNATLDALVTPTAAAYSGFFTVTLTWDQDGDVDLHAFEPDGTHVFYANRAGHSGSLDVDDTRLTGPEHYTTSCDATKLAEGTYSIGVNNFGAVTGTHATVQLSSWELGPIVTKTIDVGAARGGAGNNSPIPAISVTVSKDPVTGKFSVAGQ